MPAPICTKLDALSVFRVPFGALGCPRALWSKIELDTASNLVWPALGRKGRKFPRGDNLGKSEKVSRERAHRSRGFAGQVGVRCPGLQHMEPGSPGGLDPQLSRTLLLLLLSTASAQEVAPNRAACVVSHAVNGSSVSCHPPAQIPRRFPADTVSLVVEFFNVTRLPDDTLRGLARLQELHLSSNQLESLSPNFLLPAPLLQVLDLTRNRLARLPRGLFQASGALHTLVLKQNQLEALEPSWLLGLKALRHLDLSENRLQTLPPGLLANVTSLRILDLSNNQLKALPPDLLKGPLRLERLHLEGNRLQVLGEGLLAPQPDLRYLFLSDNKLAAVAAGALRGLRQLGFLDLSNNLLTGTPKGLWTSLGQPARDMKDGFDISGNPWICDGNLEDLYGWLVANKDKMFSRNATRCAGPEAWKGQTLLVAAESH
ncbi:leucine-rich alpha-2-glycoprotein isoform X1 [Panthera pardus]|uniref:Leucine-rich alpha-2-glycoprotein isoform X1 n=1 Tax=Panthera pardus TaxID=9691 RepID=A0A9V1EQI5_PANPR|nr:leucine-rich alpha-2-glycoprotein isoform X1 [Panthera pardus]